MFVVWLEASLEFSDELGHTGSIKPDTLLTYSERERKPLSTHSGKDWGGGGFSAWGLLTRLKSHAHLPDQLQGPG